MTRLEQQPRVHSRFRPAAGVRRLFRPAADESAGAVEPHQPPRPTRPWYLSTIGLALGGSVLLWGALPPLDLGLLGFVAPVCWLVLVRRHHLDGRHPYRNIFVAGLLFWLAALYWLTLPHWTASLGWVALSIYLACYVTLFVALSRVAVHRFRIPVMISAPIIWVGLEWVRAHLLTGFLMASLAHTQHRWTVLIQISDVAGAYGVSLLVMFVAACVARMLPIERHRAAVWPLLPLVAALVATLGYGQWRMGVAETRPGPTVSLIQGSIDTEFGGDPRKQKSEIQQQYLSETQRALHERPDIDVLVWPESMCWVPQVIVDADAYLSAAQLIALFDIPANEAHQAEATRRLPEDVLKRVDEVQFHLDDIGRVLAAAQDTGLRRSSAARAAPSNGKPDSPPRPLLMLGMDTEHYVPGAIQRYSSSVLLDTEGRVTNFYHKMHPVVFGEYVPLGEYFPWLYSLTPLPGGLSAGSEPKVFEVAGARAAPNICYETVMPHLIRRQVETLRARGTEPDLLVTQTNDGWFYGSAALDMHLICSVFRAVECRKPMLIAANTGISAAIDGNGEIIAELPRRTIGHLTVDVKLDSRDSPYIRYGDVLGMTCATACAALMVGSLVWRPRKTRHAALGGGA